MPCDGWHVDIVLSPIGPTRPINSQMTLAAITPMLCQASVSSMKCSVISMATNLVMEGNEVSANPSKGMGKMTTPEITANEVAGFIEKLEQPHAHWPRKSRWSQIARKTGISWRRVKALANREARRIDAHEYKVLEALANETDAEIASLHERIARLESLLLEEDAQLRRQKAGLLGKATHDAR